MADHLFAVGSFTESYAGFRAAGEGLSLARLREDGGLDIVDRLEGLPNPSYLQPIAGNHLLATLEVDDARNGIATIAVDSGRLRLLQHRPTVGRVLCHLDTDPAGRWLAGACYGSGHVFTGVLGAEERVVDILSTVQRSGRSVHPLRQTVSHPHAVRFSPDARWLVVPDLGTDEVACYRFAEGRLDTAQPVVWRAPVGSGPRLVRFSRDGRHLLLVHELTSEVSSLRFDDGVIEPVARISSLLTPFPGENTAAGLHWHPGLSIFAVSNRGAQTIAFFHFDGDSGVVSPWFDIPSGGEKPRDFAFSPCGRWILAANQNDDSLVVWEMDWKSGKGRSTGERLTLGTPSCVAFLKGQRQNS
jgi:6-phosphogluconolactonase